MNRRIASVLLYVMLLWMLLITGVQIYLSTLMEPIILGFELKEGFFIGALLVASIVAFLAIVYLAVKPKDIPQITNAKKNYAAVGIMISAFGIFMMVLGACYDPVMSWIFGRGIMEQNWYIWVKNIMVTYVMCLIVAGLMSKQVEKTPIERHKMTIGQFICAIFMNAGVIGVGAILGAIANLFMTYRFGVVESSSVADMMLGSNDLWRTLVVAVGAPVVEELVFRKFLIDRVHKYGEGIAIFVSGVMFGLFHGNFSQVFFATGVGMFLAFIYVRTGKVWYTILLHMVVNMSTSVITVNLIEELDMELIESFAVIDIYSEESAQLLEQIMPSLLLLGAWVLFLIICTIVGWILWGIKFKKMYLKKTEEYVEKKKLRTAFCNFGMIYFLLICFLRFVSFYI